MIRTIQIAKHILVQGVVESTAANGQICVRVGDKTYTGWPVS
ncbi:hypothetical protein [Paracoccus sp. (in: a-proteobacteria)]|nr:hypothetical protein [Paracoccus sp. (in: a-proteobacteria)]MDO5648414.1 hypothetical protein [Paracoccus sp. (in: a-proteobacteria)]